MTNHVVPRFCVRFPNGMFLHSYDIDCGCTCVAKKSEAKVYFSARQAEKIAKAFGGGSVEAFSESFTPESILARSAKADA